MAFPVLEPIEELQKQADGVQIKNIKPTISKVYQNISVKKDETINFLIVWTAVLLYYFFSGLTMLFRGKLPRGWTQFDKKKLVNLISNIESMTDRRKEMRRYGHVVDLDKPTSKTNLI
jgi:hypothetical protein